MTILADPITASRTSSIVAIPVDKINSENTVPANLSAGNLLNLPNLFWLYPNQGFLDILLTANQKVSTKTLFERCDNNLLIYIVFLRKMYFSNNPTVFRSLDSSLIARCNGFVAQ